MPRSCARILPSLRSLRRSSPITHKIVSRSAKEYYGDRLTTFMVNVRSVPARQERVENFDALVETVHVATGVPPIITCSLTDDASRRAAPYIRHRARIPHALDVAGRFRRDLKLAQLIVAVACADYGDFAGVAIVGDFPG